MLNWVSWGLEQRALQLMLFLGVWASKQDPSNDITCFIMQSVCLLHTGHEKLYLVVDLQLVATSLGFWPV